MPCFNKNMGQSSLAAQTFEQRVAPTLCVQFEELIDHFLRSHDVKEISRDGYRRRLRQFFKWCLENNVSQPTREIILQYKRYLQAKGFTPTSECAYMVAVRTFFTWAETEKLYPNVAKGIRGAKRQKGFRRDPLTVPQVHELLSSIDRTTLKGHRDFALLNLMIRTGPRTIEITRANIGDLRQQSGQTVLWLQGKGSDVPDAFVVLTDETLRPILEYLSARGTSKETEPLFGSTSDNSLHQRMTTKSVRRIVKTRLRGIKIDTLRLSAHSLRHTAVTLALIGGASIQEAQQMARHADLNTTLIYSHNIQRSAGVPERKIDEVLKPTAT